MHQQFTFFIRLGIFQEDFCRSDQYNSTYKPTTFCQESRNRMLIKQFVVLRSFWENYQKLSIKKEKLQIFRISSTCASNQNEPLLNSKKPCAATVFQIAKPILERAHDRAQKATFENKLQPILLTKCRHKIKKKIKKKINIQCQVNSAEELVIVKCCGNCGKLNF